MVFSQISPLRSVVSERFLFEEVSISFQFRILFHKSKEQSRIELRGERAVIKRKSTGRVYANQRQARMNRNCRAFLNREAENYNVFKVHCPMAAFQVTNNCVCSCWKAFMQKAFNAKKTFNDWRHA